MNKIILATLSSLIFLTACSKSTAHPADQLRVDVGSEVSSLDPTIAEDVNAARIIDDLFSKLVDYDQQNNVIPGLASSWEVSGDGKTYTFHLRKDVKFSDGTPITANDFVYSWQRLVNPKTASSYNFLLDGVVNGQAIIDGKLPPDNLGVSAPDKNTFVVKLIAPDAAFLARNTLGNLAVVPQKVIEKYGDKWTMPGNIVTSGAYVLKEHIVNGYILAEKNPYYYDAKEVSISQVKYFPYVDTNAAVASYASGSLDTTYQNVPIDQFAKIKKDYTNQLHTVKQEALGFYEFNMKLPELANNLKLRQALSMAIDREVLSNQVLNGEKSPVYSVVTPTVENGKYAQLKYEWAGWPAEKRIAEAKKLYALAGYSENHPLNITITYNTNDMYKKISLALAAMWKANLGVNVTLANQEWKQFLLTRHKADYQVARGGWFADYNSVSNYTSLYTCDSPQNDSKFCDHKFDAMVTKAAAERNPEKRQALYLQALQIVQDSYSILPLFQFSYTRLVKPYIKDYDIDHNYLDHVQSKWMKIAN